MMIRSRYSAAIQTVLGAAALFFVSSLATGAAIDLSLDRGPGPGEITLSWSGRTAPYEIYRSTDAATVIGLANYQAQTEDQSWVDARPVGSLFFYNVITCQSSAELCDGIDNDCDTWADEGCMTPCVDSTECAPEEQCGIGGLCLPDLGLGQGCDENGDCLSGQCTDAVCCDAVCDGTCETCNQPGQEGICLMSPLATDPDGECDGFSCDGYYWTFAGSTCYEAADVGDAQATCDGFGSCNGPAELCPGQGQGDPFLTCDANCQTPTGGTCSGTTPGECTNLDPGNDTCGFGPCQVTEPACFNGAPNTCMPDTGQSGPEVCNDVDDDCDGTTDNGAFTDSFETNDSCGQFTILPTVGSNQTIIVNTPTLYPAGDVDYYRITAEETDSTCSCCDAFCFDEEYQLRIALITPPGAGAYQFCTGSSCEPTQCSVVQPSGSLEQIHVLDGSCGEVDSYDYWVRVERIIDPGLECQPYVLQYTLFTGCF